MSDNEDTLRTKVRDISNAADFLRARELTIESSLEESDANAFDELHGPVARFLIKNVSHNLIITIRALHDPCTPDRITLHSYANDTGANQAYSNLINDHENTLSELKKIRDSTLAHLIPRLRDKITNSLTLFDVIKLADDTESFFEAASKKSHACDDSDWLENSQKFWRGLAK